MTNLSLGKKVKNARLEKKLTQQEVVGDFITRNMLSQIENNIAKPSIKTIEFLANRLDKPLSYFLEDEENSTLPNRNSLESIFQHSSFLIKNNEDLKCSNYLKDFLKEFKFNKKNVYYPRILSNLSHSLINLGNNSEALNLLQESIPSHSNQEDHYYLAISFYDLSYIYHCDQKYEEAEHCLNNAIKSLNKSHVKDILLELKLYYSLGYALYKNKKLNKAITPLSYSIKLSDKSHCYYNSGKTHMLLGLVYKSLKNIDSAIYHTKKAIRFFEFTEEYNLKAASEKNLGNLLIIKEDFFMAENVLNSALQYFQEEDSISKVNAIKSDLLEILLKQGNYSKAIEYFEEINYNELSNIDRCTLFTNLGECFLGIGDFEKSITYFHESLRILDEYPTHETLYKTYNNLAQVYSKLGDFEKAYNYSNKTQVALKNSLDDN